MKGEGGVAKPRALAPVARTARLWTRHSVGMVEGARACWRGEVGFFSSRGEREDGLAEESADTG